MNGATKEVSFVFGDQATVPTFIGKNLRDEVVKHILDVKADRLLLICDQAADELHGEYFQAFRPVYSMLEESSDKIAKTTTDMPILEKMVMPGGDACKSWHHLSNLAEWAFSIGATKKSLIVGFGGGALLNLTGLFASMLFRGTKLMYVPTTFLAMHDVTTSLKTSICVDGRKNNMGTFYAPINIFIDATFCKTLPRAELFSGLGELAKNACLFGGKHAEGFLSAFAKKPANGDFKIDDHTLMSLLALGIDAKMTVLKVDAKERTDGMVFEYGHTVSHAIEKAYGDGVVPHGVGVTYGMLSSSYAAEKLGIMTAVDRKVHDELCWKLLENWPLPEPKPSIERVMALAMKDSKRGICSEADGEISDVLLRKLGDVVPTKTQNLSKFPCKLIYEWLGHMGFKTATGDNADEGLHGPVTESDCDDMIKAIGCSTERQLGTLGYESLTRGFANAVYAVTRRGYPLVVKALMDMSSKRLDRGTIGHADVYAGRFGIGPKVYYASKAGLVMDRLSGRTLAEADMHKGDFRLLDAVADLLARCHQLPSPPQFRDGVPLVWRQIDRMMDIIARRPELIPKELPDIDTITAEINFVREVLEKQSPKVVFCHGSMNPHNVMMNTDGSVKFIDFELGGPNYRGFDLMKLFRTSETPSERCMEYFLRVYAQGVDDQASVLMKEARLFEPLTWLEAAVFFLAMPLFKPEGSSTWNELACHRWTKFMETKSLLV